MKTNLLMHGNFLKKPHRFKASSAIFWSLGGQKEPKFPKTFYCVYKALHCVLFLMLNCSFKSLGMCRRQKFKIATPSTNMFCTMSILLLCFYLWWLQKAQGSWNNYYLKGSMGGRSWKRFVIEIFQSLFLFLWHLFSLCMHSKHLSLHKAGVKVVNDCKTDDITLICYKVLGYAMAVQLWISYTYLDWFWLNFFRVEFFFRYYCSVPILID